MRARKGFIFTADAIFAFYLITIMLSILLLLSYTPKIYAEQSQTLAKDVLTVMNSIKMKDLAADYRFPFSARLNYIKNNSVSSWSMFLRTPDHNNSIPSAYPLNVTPLPNAVPAVLWHSGPGLSIVPLGFTVYSSPIVYNGKVVIASRSGTYLVDENTGYKFWSLPAAGDSTPAVSNGRIFVGTINNLFYCIDEAGNVVWNQTLLGSVISSPAVHNNKVFFGSMDNNVYALDQNLGNVTWFYTTGGNISSSPAVYNDKVFVFSNDGVLYALNENTKQLVWFYNTSSRIVRNDIPFDPSPVVSNDMIYFSNGNKFYALNSTNGSLNWTYTDINIIFTSSPVVDKGRVYVGYSRGLLVLNATTGAFMGKHDLGAAVISTPIITNESIIAVNEDGYMVAKKRDDFFSPIWSYDIGKNVTASPALVNGRIYIPTTDGDLYVFGNCSLWDENMPVIDTISGFWLISQNPLNRNSSQCAKALAKELLDATVPSNYGSEIAIKSAGIQGQNCNDKRSPNGEDSVYTDDCNKTKYQRILIQDSRYLSGVVQKGSTIYYAQNPLEFELRIWN